jgi:hypothetical protein
MKMLLLAGTALLAFAASVPAARAQRVNFTYTGELVTWTVPETGTYQIIAFGAQGGSCTAPATGSVGAGGLGAEIGGDFVLSKGEVLQVAVGGAGEDNCAAGGGGSFVVGPNNTPLVIAGGGGGGGFYEPTQIGVPGGDGLTGTDGGGADPNTPPPNGVKRQWRPRWCRRPG